MLKIKKMKILVINPGSTSTKISLFEDKKELFREDIFHDAPKLLKYPHINDQMLFRRKVIDEILKRHCFDIKEIDAVVGRGGSAYPQKSGVIRIDERLYEDTVNAVGGSEHAAKLGVMLAYEYEKEFGIPTYTLNATNVDELIDEARITGIKGVYRNAQSHVLNQKAVASYYAKTINSEYEKLNLIVCHIDGGITVGAHRNGQLIDCNVGSGGDGSFTPTRIGSVPVLPLLDYIEKHSLEDVRLMCSRSGGFVSFFGTSDVKIVREKIAEGDKEATLIWNSMLYNIVKGIGSMHAVLQCKTDAIILTGGFIRYEDLVEYVNRYCGAMAKVVCISDKEQETLALETLKVLNGETEASKYTGKPVFEGFKFIE